MASCLVQDVKCVSRVVCMICGLFLRVSCGPDSAFVLPGSSLVLHGVPGDAGGRGQSLLCGVEVC